MYDVAEKEAEEVGEREAAAKDETAIAGKEAAEVVKCEAAKNETAIVPQRVETQAPLKIPRVRRKVAEGQVHGPLCDGAGGPEGLARATSQSGQEDERKGGPEGSERAASSSGRA